MVLDLVIWIKKNKMHGFIFFYNCFTLPLQGNWFENEIKKLAWLTK